MAKKTDFRFVLFLIVIIGVAGSLSSGGPTPGERESRKDEAVPAPAPAPARAAEATPEWQRSSAGLPTSTQSMSFAECNSRIDAMEQEVTRGTPHQAVPIVDTADMRVVRFPTADGSLLVTCSRPDRKMVLVQSSRRD